MRGLARGLFLHDFPQELHERLFVVVDLATFARNDARVQADVLGERDCDEAVVRQHGRCCEERRACPLPHEVLDGMEVRGVVDDLRLLPDGRIGVVDEAVDEELAVEKRQRPLADVLDADNTLGKVIMMRSGDTPIKDAIKAL